MYFNFFRAMVDFFRNVVEGVFPLTYYMDFIWLKCGLLLI